MTDKERDRAVIRKETENRSRKKTTVKNINEKERTITISVQETDEQSITTEVFVPKGEHMLV